ncbi:MAG: YdcH family protein [Rhodospirillales bacterium]|nr:YdcH family protein [Rhodospirillales bacterium]
MDEVEALREKLSELRDRHRDLNETIDRMASGAVALDMFALQRLKKERLSLKEMIVRIEGMIVDDIIA